MTPRVLVGAAVALVVAATTAVSWWRRDPGSAVRPARENTAALPRELANMKADLAGSRGSTTPVRGAVDPSAAASSSPRHAAHPLDELRAQEREAARRVVAAYDQRLREEPPDPAWDGEVKPRIDGAMTTLASTLPGVKAQSVDCGSTLCRVVVVHEDPGSQKQLTGKISKIPPFDNEVYYAYDHDSSPPKTTLYVARTGTHLPPLSD